MKARQFETLFQEPGPDPEIRDLCSWRQTYVESRVVEGSRHGRVNEESRCACTSNCQSNFERLSILSRVIVLQPQSDFVSKENKSEAEVVWVIAGWDPLER